MANSDEFLRVLDPPPGWQPDTEAALSRMHARMRPQRRNRVWAKAAAIPIAVFLLFSAGRVAAQLWQSLIVKRVAVIAVNAWPAGVPSPHIQAFDITTPPLPARNADEAAWRVNYQPRLPHAGVLSGAPALYTIASVGAGMVVHTADLEAALQKLGITDRTVPANWDGAQLALHTSPLVIAQWPDVVMVQSQPLTLSAPPGFDFPAFSMTILRILGVEPREAQRLAQLDGTAPVWLAPLNREMLGYLGALEEVKLNSGPATMLSGKNRIALLWMVPDRVYLMSGSVSRELMIAAANAVQ